MRWIAIISVTVGICLASALATGWLRLEVKGESVSDESGANKSEPRRIFASGFVEGASREVALQFEVAGRLKKLHVRAGDTVNAGTVLAELDPEAFELKHQEAVSQWKLANAELDRLLKGASEEARETARTSAKAIELQMFEEADVMNALKLAIQKGTEPLEKLDQARTRYARVVAEFNALRQQADLLDAAAHKEDVTVAEARRALADVGMKQAEAQLRKTQLTASVTGSILQVGAEAGELVGPQANRAIVTIADLSRTRVRCYVEEYDALRVEKGDEAIVTSDGKPEVKLKGTVISCASYVAPKNFQHLSPGERHDLRVREVVIQLPQNRELIIGLPVEVFITPSTAP